MTNGRTRLNIGVDIGGTKIAAGLVDAQGEILDQVSFATDAPKGPDFVIGNLVEHIRLLLDRNGLRTADVHSIGVGVPGTVDLKTGEVILAPNIFWRNVPLGDRLRRAFPGLAIYADYDTNAAALGEYLACGDAAVENLFFLTISTGVGSGIIINRRLYRGRGNTAGEIGHTVVERDGVECTCGNRGCLQQYAKGPAIADYAKAVLETERQHNSVLHQYLIEGDLTAETVARAAVNGDPLARSIMTRAARYVGISLANVISLLAPDLIVIGGGVAKTGDLFLKPILEVAKDRCYPPARNLVRIKITDLWEKANIIGASLLYSTLE